MAQTPKEPRVKPRLVPDIDIELDKVRHVRFDMQACWEAEKIYTSQQADGKQYALAEMLTGGTVGAICCMLWASLRHEDPELTLAETMSLLTPADVNKVSRILLQAVTGQTGVPEDEAKPKVDSDQKKTDQQVEPLIGASSGLSPE